MKNLRFLVPFCVLLVSVAGCRLVALPQWYRNITTISAVAQEMTVGQGFEKATALLTVLDYTISRVTTVNSLGLANFYTACRSDFSLSTCESMEKKHETTDQDIHQTDDHRAATFYRNLSDDETLEAHVVIKRQGNGILVTIDFGDNEEISGRKPHGFSQAAVDDVTAIIKSFERSFGSDHVNAVRPSLNQFYAPIPSD